MKGAGLLGVRKEISFTAWERIDTPKKCEYFVHGGILHYMIRQLVA